MTFCPNGLAFVELLNSDTTTVTTIDISSADPETGAIRIYTTNPGNAHFAFGPTATTSDPVLFSAVMEYFKIPAGATEFSMISSSGSPNVFLSIGQIL